MKYEIEVTSKVTLEIEAEDVGKAVVEACETAWQYDPDEQNAVVVRTILTAEEAIAMIEQDNRADDDPERNELRQQLEKAFRNRPEKGGRNDY